jgi:predicted CopG family antitoxin
VATKTISIDLEAYERLKGRKKEGESFSQAIKRLVSKPFDYKKWLDDLAAHPASDEFIEAVERVVADRRAPQNMGARDAVSGHHRSGRPAATSRKGGKAKGRSRAA